MKRNLSKRELTQAIAKGIYFTQEQARLIQSYAPTLADLRLDSRESEPTVVAEGNPDTDSSQEHPR